LGILSRVLHLQSNADGIIKRRCGVYNHKTGKMCSRKSCDSCLCWQHRYLLTNTGGESMRCGAVYSGCGGAPAPRSTWGQSPHTLSGAARTRRA
jgi:hypothetical protein